MNETMRHLLLLRKYDKAGRSPPRRVKNLSALNDVDDLAATLCTELHRACYEGEESVIAATADASTGVKVSSTLADNDFAGLDDLATIALDAQVLGVRVASVTGR
jgi:hypothetical protein